MTKLDRMNEALDADLWMAILGPCQGRSLHTILDLPAVVERKRLHKALRKAIKEACAQGLDLGEYDYDDVIEALLEAEKRRWSGDEDE